MSVAQGKGVRSALDIPSWPVWRFRSWPIRENPRPVLAYLAAVAAVYAAALAAAIRVATVGPRELIIFGLLTAASLATVEATRLTGENAGTIKDIFGVWELPVAILLPPLYALIASFPRIVLTQYRITHIPLHRRLFTAAAIGLSYGAASWAFHAVDHTFLQHLGNQDLRHGGWLLTVTAAGMLQWLVNQGLVLTVMRLFNPAMRIREQLADREGLRNDATELCVGALVALCVSITILAVFLAFPFVTLLQRSQRHAKLVSDSRHDSKTGLLNAGTWETEANAEVTRAARTRTPLAVALIDIDSFKAVNDTYGHLSGDRALIAIARTIKVFLRDYDVVGRFGGEEFSLLLPQTDSGAARGIAERIRAHIADMPIALSDAADAEVIRITVSIGVAALGGTGRPLTELLATADAALYRAKNAGRNQVWVTTDTESFGARSERDGAGAASLG